MQLQQHSALAGRVIAVTGASRGIGRALVEMSLVEGATVVAGARVFDAPLPLGAMAFDLDVTDEDSVRAFAAACEAAGVDSLVNNAGVGSFATIEDSTEAQYRRIFDTNVLGTLLAAKHFFPMFRRRHQQGLVSRMVHVTSDVSTRTFVGGGLYTASKHAQRAISQTVAREGEACGLLVTEVRTGMVDTHFNERTPGSPERAHHLQPSDVARTILFALAAPRYARVDELVIHPNAQPVEF